MKLFFPQFYNKNLEKFTALYLTGCGALMLSECVQDIQQAAVATAAVVLNLEGKDRWCIIK